MNTDFKNWFYSKYNIDNEDNYQKFYNIYKNEIKLQYNNNEYDVIYKWLNDNLEITNDKNDLLKIKDIYEMYKKNPLYTELSKRKKRQINFQTFTYDIIANSKDWSKYFAKNRIKKTAAVRLVGVKFRNEVM